MTRRHPTSTLFPYTTLFRSRLTRNGYSGLKAHAQLHPDLVEAQRAGHPPRSAGPGSPLRQQVVRQRVSDRGRRSEEHTSELQSRQYLVCRLLLEKKKDTNND